VSLLLLDTHLLIWAAREPRRMHKAARAMIEDTTNALAFSAASIWEVAIKASRRRPGFDVDPAKLRAGLLSARYRELLITSAHAIEAGGLPPLHKDPFDRLLIAQARLEGAALLTADAALARYGTPVSVVS
jgi:PIN domain nuclease of toxin-antitoxin system